MPCDNLAPLIEVMLVDDQRAILAGVTALIESAGPGLRVAGRAQNGREALDLARIIQPTVIVLDVDLGGESGLELIPGLRALCSAEIIVFTCLTEPELRHRTLKLGATRLVSKTAPGRDLIGAILCTAGRLRHHDNCPVQAG